MTHENLIQYIDNYRKYLLTKNYSSHSRDAYLSDLAHFQKFHRDHPGDWKGREYLSRFLKELFIKNYTHSSIHRYRSSLSNFFDYLVKEKILPSSPTQLLGRYKRKHNPPTIWSQEKMRDVVNKMESNIGQDIGVARYRKYRDLLITEALYGLGLRISELTHIQVKDIGDGMVMILGKGGQHQLIPLTPRLLKIINQYLEERNDFLSLIRKKDHGALLCNHRGDPLTIRGVRHAFGSRLQSQGAGRLHPHALRHSIAGHLLENGAGIRQVQKVLRHKSIATTQIYTQLSSQFLKKEYHKNHPLNTPDDENKGSSSKTY